MIEEILESFAKENGEEQLIKNFSIPNGIQQSYDLLLGFHRFSSFYKALITESITHAELGRIIVHPKFQKQGLALLIIESLIDLARKNSIEVLFLACIYEHKNLYEQKGFRCLYQINSNVFINVGVPAIAMACIIDKRHNNYLERFFIP